MAPIIDFRVIYKKLKLSFFTILIIAIQAYITSATAEIIYNTTKNTLESNVATELNKIKKEKLDIEAKSKVQEAACYKKFAVSSCMSDVKNEKLAALNDAKRRELELNNQLRLQKENSLQEKKEKKENSETVKKSKDEATSLNPESLEKSDTKPEASKVSKTAKVPKIPKTRAEKTPGDQQRLNAANKRVADANQKLAANQKKKQLKANKQAQSNTQEASYNKKVQLAEAHKNELAQKQAAKTKPKSASLPTPSAAEIIR